MISICGYVHPFVLHHMCTPSRRSSFSHCTFPAQIFTPLHPSALHEDAIRICLSHQEDEVGSPLMLTVYMALAVGMMLFRSSSPLSVLSHYLYLAVALILVFYHLHFVAPSGKHEGQFWEVQGIL